jgi:hypothetical protein
MKYNKERINGYLLSIRNYIPQMTMRANAMSTVG